MDAADTFFPLVLGVQSLLQRFDRVLEMVPAAPDEAGYIETPLISADRSTIELVLGLIALRNRLRAHLDGASPRPGETTRIDTPARTTAAEQHLRSLLR